jgi:hypothetical protein
MARWIVIASSYGDSAWTHVERETREEAIEVLKTKYPVIVEEKWDVDTVIDKAGYLMKRIKEMWRGDGYSSFAREERPDLF